MPEPALQVARVEAQRFRRVAHGAQVDAGHARPFPARARVGRERHVRQVQDPRERRVDPVDLAAGEPDLRHGGGDLVERGGVVHAVDVVAAALVEVVVPAGVAEPERGGARRAAQLVEGVVVALAGLLAHDARLLEQVVVHPRA